MMISVPRDTEGQSARKSPGRIRRCDRHGPYKAEQVGGRHFSIHILGCPKCEEERKEREREKEREKKITHLLRQSRIPKRFRACTIQGFLGDTPGICDARAIGKGYVKRFQEHKEKGRCLVFFGKPGAGKTHLSCAIGLDLIRQGYSVLYTTEYRATRAVKATWDRNAEEDEWKILKGYLKPDLLILDEVGVGFNSDAEKVIFYQLMNTRYEQIKPTIIIGNLTEGELVEHVGERIMDRLRDQGGVTVAFDWESYRK